MENTQSETTTTLNEKLQSQQLETVLTALDGLKEHTEKELVQQFKLPPKYKTITALRQHFTDHPHGNHINFVDHWTYGRLQTFRPTNSKKSIFLTVNWHPFHPILQT